MRRRVSAFGLRELGRKSLLKDAGTGAFLADAHLSRHVGERALPIPPAAAVRAVAVPLPDAVVEYRRSFSGDPVGSRLVLASPAPSRADPHHRRMPVAAPGPHGRDARVICGEAACSMAASRQARADRLPLSDP